MNSISQRTAFEFRIDYLDERLQRELGTSDNHPIDPVYYIEDCPIYKSEKSEPRKLIVERKHLFTEYLLGA